MKELKSTVNKLIHHIERLLLNHDCVIIPGLGAVLAHGLPALYDEDREEWAAPSRVVSFNPELSRTDGLLASSIARRDGISIDAASSLVRAEVEKMRKELESSGTLSLGSVGSLEMTSEGTLAFRPGNAPWLSPSCLWLPSFRAVPLESASILARRHGNGDRHDKWLTYALRRGSRIAAAVAVLLALGWIVAQNLAYAPDDQYASIAPVYDNAHHAAVQPQSPASPVVLVLARAPKDEVIENIAVGHDVRKTDITVSNSAKPAYYLIVASLASMAEAEKYVREHSDTNLGILAKDGRYRVYAASGNTSEEVLAASKTEEIASRYPSSWVCRR